MMKSIRAATAGGFALATAARTGSWQQRGMIPSPAPRFPVKRHVAELYPRIKAQDKQTRRQSVPAKQAAEDGETQPEGQGHSPGRRHFFLPSVFEKRPGQTK
jgi:hypothetical protein